MRCGLRGRLPVGDPVTNVAKARLVEVVPARAIGQNVPVRRVATVLKAKASLAEVVPVRAIGRNVPVRRVAIVLTGKARLAGVVPAGAIGRNVPHVRKPKPETGCIH